MSENHFSSKILYLAKWSTMDDDDDGGRGGGDGWMKLSLDVWTKEKNAFSQRGN